MAKFYLTKKLNLDFLGGLWKEKGAYLEFHAFTIRDLKDKLPNLAQKVDPNDASSVSDSLGETLTLLEDKFVAGKAIDEKGELVDVSKEDLGDLPAEAIKRLIGFLSSTLEEESTEEPS